jgi:hypothetical protein
MVAGHHHTLEGNTRILRVPLQGSQVVASMEVDVPAIVSRVLDLLGTQRERVEARLHGQAGDLGADFLGESDRLRGGSLGERGPIGGNQKVLEHGFPPLTGYPAAALLASRSLAGIRDQP